MDKINIVIHRLYSKCPLAWTHAQCLPRHWSIVSPKIDCSRPHQTPFQFIHYGYAGALSCWNKVVTRHSAYRWQQYDVIMTSWSSTEKVSKRYHQNFLLCNNNEITSYIADVFNSFCEEVYAVPFFKVVQQQTIA